MVLQQKPLEKADFIVKITCPVMVRLASSDKWKGPLACVPGRRSKTKGEVNWGLARSAKGARGGIRILLLPKSWPHEKRNKLP